MIKNRFECHVSVCNAFIDLYEKCGFIEDARRVFDKMSLQDVVSWTVMVLASTKQGFAEEALALF